MIDMENSGSPRISTAVALIVVSTTASVIAFIMAATPIALPAIGRDLAMKAAMLGWVATALSLPQAAMLLAAGRLADIYGRKKIFLSGMILFTIASVLCGIAGSGIQLIIYRLLQGIGGGMVFGTSMALLTSIVPVGERGRAFGINAAAVFVGISAGPVLGGVMTQHLGWRSIFFLSAILGVVVLCLTIWKLKGEWAEARGEKFDTGGAVIFGISLVLMMYGLTVLPTEPGFYLIAAGLLGLFVFARWEARVEHPILDIGVFRKNLTFIFANMTMLIHFTGTFSLVFLTSLFLQYNQGFSPQAAGLIMLIQTVCPMVVAPFAGRLSDRIDPRLLSTAGMLVTCVSFLMFIFLNDATPTWYIMTGLAFFGIGVGIFASPNSNAIMSSAPRRYLGVAAGMQGTMRSCGQILGMGIVLILFSIYIGNAEITPDKYAAFLSSAKAAFIIFSVINIAGSFTPLLSMKEKFAFRAQ